ncbi:MAG: hypothetical protein Q9M91_04475 [Candidatus Dojkabacteria bacterium]|nr:hypothetical protein [Candidatus Dojkabacteria bacterium]MDQ7021067.1 hypothetical protein [Candidatus Dojkabacteria bacterium]
MSESANLCKTCLEQDLDMGAGKEFGCQLLSQLIVERIDNRIEKPISAPEDCRLDNLATEIASDILLQIDTDSVSNIISKTPITIYREEINYAVAIHLAERSNNERERVLKALESRLVSLNVTVIEEHSDSTDIAS